MDQAGAFLQSIIEAPEDDAPRLIFADWLDDNDQPERAEFIRLQIGRHALQPADPSYRAALRRENVLLMKNEVAWLGPLAMLASRCRFHRGFVEEVSLGAEQFLLNGDELFRQAPIRRVQLRNTGALPRILEEQASLQDRLAKLFAQIRVLDLNRDYLSEPTGLALLNLPKLPNLEGLHLASNALTPAGVAVLADSTILAGLTTLEFNASSPVRDMLELLLHSPHLRRIEHLLLAGNRLGDRIVRMLIESGLLSQLRSLSIGHVNLTADGVDELLHADLSRLEMLDLSFNALDVDGAIRLARMPRRERLTMLNLSRTGMGDRGTAILANSPLFGQLFGIDLSLNRIDERGGQALAASKQPASFGTLDLIYNPLGAETRAILSQRFGEEVCLFQR